MPRDPYPRDLVGYGREMSLLHGDEQSETFLSDLIDPPAIVGARAGVWRLLRLFERRGKLAGLERFIRYAQGHDDVWFCRRIDIARHWRERHPYAG
jgi:allantoinase